MYYYKGNGLVNSAINNLPFEMHIPGYRYCGPGTALQKRLERGDVGINELDEACKEHDIFYSKNKDVTQRHKADKILQERAYKRMFAGDASFGEKLAAFGVNNIMKAKVKLGMGFVDNNRKHNKSVKAMEKIKKSTQALLKTIDAALQNLMDLQPKFKIKNKKPSLTVKHTKTGYRKRTQNCDNMDLDMDINPNNDDVIFAEKRSKQKRKLDLDVDIDIPKKRTKYNEDEEPLTRSKIIAKRKRKTSPNQTDLSLDFNESTIIPSLNRKRKLDDEDSDVKERRTNKELKLM